METSFESLVAVQSSYVPFQTQLQSCCNKARDSDDSLPQTRLPEQTRNRRVSTLSNKLT